MKTQLKKIFKMVNWNITVNVITYSSTNYVIEQMNMSQLDSGTFTIAVDYLTGKEFGQNAL